MLITFQGSHFIEDPTFQAFSSLIPGLNGTFPDRGVESPILMDWVTILGIHEMSIWIPHSVFWDWRVDFGPPSLKYSYALDAKFGASKPVIIIYSYVVKSWFTFANL